MTTVMVKLGKRSYEIIIGHPLQGIGKAVRERVGKTKTLVVTNPTVGAYYLDAVRKSLQGEGFQVFIAEVPDGEEFKSLREASRLYDVCVEKRLERSSLIVALGGGVIGDLAGYVASTFMRGLPMIQVPTTLLAQVDSSVGGKVAVNLPAGKNLVGSFYQPLLVYIDPSVLKTLPEREVRAGIAEVIKYGVILDRRLFAYLEEKMTDLISLDQEVLERVIASCCRLKARVVEKDEREKGLRSILNFGHTVGHAIEVLTEYKVFRHGEAVAIGMVCASRISEELGMLSRLERIRIEQLIIRAGLPATVSPDLSVDRIMEALRLDKKVREGKVRFVLPQRIGRVAVKSDIPGDVVVRVLERMRQQIN